MPGGWFRQPDCPSPRPRVCGWRRAPRGRRPHFPTVPAHPPRDAMATPNARRRPVPCTMHHPRARCAGGARAAGRARYAAAGRRAHDAPSPSRASTHPSRAPPLFESPQPTAQGRGPAPRAARCRRPLPAPAASRPSPRPPACGWDARRTEALYRPTIVPARTPRDAMTTPERLALDANGRPRVIRRPRWQACAPGAVRRSTCTTGDSRHSTRPFASAAASDRRRTQPRSTASASDASEQTANMIFCPGETVSSGVPGFGWCRACG
jgi:hypothetical protein